MQKTIKKTSQHKKFIIITSIYPPSEAIKAFKNWGGWEVIVVGDRKSPSGWEEPGVTYLSVDDQHRLFPAMSKLIPENTYTRKMIGYLYAINQGAEAIFESDDDNLPYDFAQKKVEAALSKDSTVSGRLTSESGWVNVYDVFGAPNAWPRGYVLPLHKNNPYKSFVSQSLIPAPVVQFLADEDPDVDAIYRMINGEAVTFNSTGFYDLEPGTYSPFNSQATLWLPEVFPLMFFPLGVPDRVTDILRGYIALAALWKTGRTLAFHHPVVYQERNPHNLHNDFVQETMLYHHAADWAKKFQTAKGQNPQQVYSAIIEQLIADEHLSSHNRTAYKQFVDTISHVQR